MKKTIKHTQECGGCLFCLCKCPECGSESVNVGLGLTWQIANNQPDSIAIDLDYENARFRFTCENCGKEIDAKKARPVEKKDALEQSDWLSRLVSEMVEHLGILEHVTIEVERNGG